jgi:hypothetical protein
VRHTKEDCDVILHARDRSFNKRNDILTSMLFIGEDGSEFNISSEYFPAHLVIKAVLRKYCEIMAVSRKSGARRNFPALGNS